MLGLDLPLILCESLDYFLGVLDEDVANALSREALERPEEVILALVAFFFQRLVMEYEPLKVERDHRQKSIDSCLEHLLHLVEVEVVMEYELRAHARVQKEAVLRVVFLAIRFDKELLVAELDEVRFVFVLLTSKLLVVNNDEVCLCLVVIVLHGHQSSLKEGTLNTIVRIYIN
uniref:Uncharacterized protein n=1 Tax=Strombidium inclinatum TaxID=197538 RepID=A0A7S3IMY1_9SPIT